MALGGYPEAVQRKAADRRTAWFAAYISTMLQRDVRDLARVDGLRALPNLLKLLAARRQASTFPTHDKQPRCDAQRQRTR